MWTIQASASRETMMKEAGAIARFSAVCTGNGSLLPSSTFFVFSERPALDEYGHVRYWSSREEMLSMTKGLEVFRPEAWTPA